MRPPAWRLERATYPYFTRIQTRYRDELLHINNVSIVGYYDEARWRFTRELFAQAGVPMRGRTVTAESRQSYLAEVFHMENVEVGTGVLRVGNSSCEIGQALFVGAECRGICASTIVFIADDRPAPLTASLRAALEEMLVRQLEPA
ncbi:acyl-CoA thioesterase [Camelimonas abortus]|uniref:Acyl-CoA thioesterase n=1 Tax=Camelimonas abortus TaxID=1017184 RepID=A0ABV7LGE1_9HYPH